MLCGLCENLLLPKRSKSDAIADLGANAAGTLAGGGQYFQALLPEITTPCCVSRALAAIACPSQASAGRERIEMFSKVFIAKCQTSDL
jgi:hypothetical protein